MIMEFNNNSNQQQQQQQYRVRSREEKDIDDLNNERSFDSTMDDTSLPNKTLKVHENSSSHNDMKSLLIHQQQQQQQTHWQDEQEQWCSFAVTGRNDAFQAIFVCRTCCSNNSNNNANNNNANNNTSNTNTSIICICQACADECHEEHDVEYIGMGPCYCDCYLKLNCCKIINTSKQKAQLLAGGGEKTTNTTTSSHNANRRNITIPPKDHQLREHKNLYVYVKKNLYLYDTFRILQLQQQDSNNYTRDHIIVQAKELIQHSKDTFWLDPGYVNNNYNQLCDLEILAWNIFCQHKQRYAPTIEQQQQQQQQCSIILGAEWWVQIKETTSNTNNYNSSFSSSSNHSSITNHSINTNNRKHNKDYAIDLHYDKDEVMAETFGLGFFPTLSTVTYLTDGTGSGDNNNNNQSQQQQQAPTVIFSRRYDEAEDAQIKQMLISHPIQGKHIVFDGRLLHGVPSHPALLLQQQQQQQHRHSFGQQRQQHYQQQGNNTTPSDTEPRITFLVNLWFGHKPYGVNVLPDHIRKSIQEHAASAIEGKNHNNNNSIGLLEGGDFNRNNHENTIISSWTIQPSSNNNSNNNNEIPDIHFTDIDDDDDHFLPYNYSQNYIMRSNNSSNNKNPYNYNPRMKKIVLPFVGGKSTWANNDNNDHNNNDNSNTDYNDNDGSSSGIVLMMYPPPYHTNDTVLVHFGSNMEPTLEYLNNNDNL